jgi:predicted DNA-binding protein
MGWQSVRLSPEDKAKLEELAEKNGMTVSEIIREMIRTGYERHAVAGALQEIRAAVGKLTAHKGGNGNNEDIPEIRRIVTLIARAMPSVAKYVP